MIMEAEGRAASIRAQGEAEAEIIFKKGEAEAKAMNVKAEAYQEFNQAAIVDKLITSMPEIVRALAAPLANVDKITVISTGGDRGHEQNHRRYHQDGGADSPRCSRPSPACRSASCSPRCGPSATAGPQDR